MRRSASTITIAQEVLLAPRAVEVAAGEPVALTDVVERGLAVEPVDAGRPVTSRAES